MKYTNGQNESQSRLSVIITKKRKSNNVHKLKNMKPLIKVNVFESCKEKVAKKLLKSSQTTIDF